MGSGKKAAAGEIEHHDEDHHHGHGHHQLTEKELNLRTKIFLTLEEPEFSPLARVISSFLNLCLFLSVIAFVLGTMPEYKHAPHHCHPHMVVGYTHWDGYGHADRVIPVDPHHKSEYNEARAIYESEKKKKKKADYDTKKGDAADPKKGDAADPKKDDGEKHRILAGAKPKPGEAYWEEICEPEPNKEIEIAEGFAMAAFTVDYLLRLLTVHAVPYRVIHPEEYVKNRSLRHYEPRGFVAGLKKTVGYFFHYMMIVDFFALAPYYFRTIVERVLPGVAMSGILRVFRLVRIFRIAPFYMHMVVSTKGVVSSADNLHFMRFLDLSVLFNFLRLGDYAEGAPLFFTTLRSAFPALAIAVLFMFILTMIFGTMIYIAESGTFKVTSKYPDGAYLVQKSPQDKSLVEPAHANIFMSMWYIISDTTTMPTTCMLGPVTYLGEAFDVVVDYLSLIVLTLPIAIIGRNYHDQYETFFRNWDVDDVEWSSDSEDEAEPDDYDAAISKLAKDKLAAGDEEEGKIPDAVELKA